MSPLTTLPTANIASPVREPRPENQGERAEEVLRENVVGSTLSGQGGVSVVAQDGSITATASALHSEQGAVPQAKQDVTLNTATERESTFSEERSPEKGLPEKQQPQYRQ